MVVGKYIVAKVELITTASSNKRCGFHTLVCMDFVPEACLENLEPMTENS